MRHAGFVASGLRQNAPVVTLPQESQAKFCGTEVIYAGRKSRQIAAHHVQFDLVKSTSAGRRSEEDFATGKLLALRDACGQKQQLRQRIKVGNCFAARHHGWRGDCGQCRDAGLPQVAWQTQDFQCGVNLEQQWLVLPIQKMGMCPDA